MTDRVFSIIIDSAVDYSARASELKTYGVGGVIRYFNPLTGGKGEKSLSAAEALRWANAGIKVGVVVEGYGLSNGTGVDRSSGLRDAQKVLAWLPTVHLPVTNKLVVWFAVDTDATTEQINQKEVDYFDTIKTVFNNYHLTGGTVPRIGVYGSGATCLAMMGTHRVDETWLAGSMGWARSSQYDKSGAWTLRQYIWPHEKWHDFDCDTNVANASRDPGLVLPVSIPFNNKVPVAPKDKPEDGGFLSAFMKSWKGLNRRDLT